MRKNVFVAVVSLGLAAGAHAAEEKILNVYNWSDYIAADTVANFEKRTGIKVNYDVFDSNEVLEAKLLAGNAGYDIVVPSAPFLERQIKAGIFAPLDREKLANYGNLDPQILNKVGRRKISRQLFGDTSWIALQGASQMECGRKGEIAQLAAGRHLYDWLVIDSEKGLDSLGQEPRKLALEVAQHGQRSLHQLAPSVGLDMIRRLLTSEERTANGQEDSEEPRVHPTERDSSRAPGERYH